MLRCFREYCKTILVYNDYARKNRFASEISQEEAEAIKRSVMQELETVPVYTGWLTRLVSFNTKYERNCFISSLKGEVNEFWSCTKGNSYYLPGYRPFKVRLHILAKSARDVSEVAQFRCEKEVLVLPGTQYEIISSDFRGEVKEVQQSHGQNAGVVVVYLQEISLA